MGRLLLRRLLCQTEKWLTISDVASMYVNVTVMNHCCGKCMVVVVVVETEEEKMRILGKHFIRGFFFVNCMEISWFLNHLI